jgi:hypothetical protein
MVEELSEVLRFHLIGNLGESDKIGKTDCELLSFADDLDVLLPSKDRIVHLRRQVLCELGGQCSQRLGLLGKILLALLQLCNV